MATLPKANISPIESIGSTMETVDRNISIIDREFKQFIEKEQERLDTVWAVEVENKFYKDVVEPFTEMTSSGEYRGKEALKLPDKTAELLLKFKESVKPSNPRQELLWKKFFDTHASRINTSAIKHANEEYMKYEVDVFNSSIKNIAESVSKNFSLEYYEEARRNLDDTLTRAQNTFKLSSEQIEVMRRDAYTNLLKNRVAGLVAAGNTKEAYEFLNSIIKTPEESGKYKIDEIKDLILRYDKDYKYAQAEEIADSVYKELLKTPNQLINPNDVNNLLKTKKIDDPEVAKLTHALAMERVREQNSFIDNADQQLIGRVLVLINQKGMSLTKALSQPLKTDDPYFGQVNTLGEALSDKGKGRLWQMWDERMRMLEREKKEDLRAQQLVNFLRIVEDPVKLRNLTVDTIQQMLFTKKLDPSHAERLIHYRDDINSFPGLVKVKKFAEYLANQGVFVPDAEDKDPAEVANINFSTIMGIMDGYISWWKQESTKEGKAPNPDVYINYIASIYAKKDQGFFSKVIQKITDVFSASDEEKKARAKIEDYLVKNKIPKVYVRFKEHGTETYYRVVKNYTGGYTWMQGLPIPGAEVIDADQIISGSNNVKPTTTPTTNLDFYLLGLFGNSNLRKEQ